MSRTLSLGSHRLLLGALVLLLVSMSLTAAAAKAQTIPAECANLQAKLEMAAKEANHGEGDTVQLSGMCEASNLKTKSGVTLPNESNFTLEGAPGTTSGFDGKGVTATMLSMKNGGESVGSMTISNLTFEHANISSSESAALQIRAAQLVLSHDSFVEDWDEGGGQGGAVSISIDENCLPTLTTALTIVGSTFSSDKLIDGSEGGALWVQQDCASANAVLEDNVFENNTLEANGPFVYTGGALSFSTNTVHEAHSSLQQSGNVFSSNSIVRTAGEGSYGGGGEWVQGANLTSVDDRYSLNLISGASGAKKWSWGGGLSILNSGCDQAATESTVINGVIAANKMEGGEAADDGGAGIYIGCGFSETNPNHLVLRNSTVTENTVTSGGIAGIDGHPQDHLALENSIVEGDVGGAELGGFTGEGGSLTATYSDVCSGTSPLTGVGNICANPLLANNGNPASFDVHETAASPTIDKGSNALVPSGLSTDFYGKPRIQPSDGYLPPCTPGARIGLTYYPAVVDMGASEFPEPALADSARVCPGQSTSASPPPAPGKTNFISIKTSGAIASLKMSCSSSDGIGCSGTIIITSAETLKGSKVIAVSASNRKAVRVAEGTFSIPAGQTATVKVKLNSTGKALLKKFHAMPSIMIANEAIAGNTSFLFLFRSVRFTEPKKHKSKKHKSKKHHKGSKHH